MGKWLQQTEDYIRQVATKKKSGHNRQVAEINMGAHTDSTYLRAYWRQTGESSPHFVQGSIAPHYSRTPWDHPPVHGG